MSLACSMKRSTQTDRGTEHSRDNSALSHQCDSRFACARGNGSLRSRSLQSARGASQLSYSLQPRGMPDMKILPPVSIQARRVLPSRWDVLAAALVLGFIVLFADASRSLVQPLATLIHTPISLDPRNLPEY